MAKTVNKKADKKVKSKKVIAKKTSGKDVKIPMTKTPSPVAETKSVPETTPNFSANVAKTISKPATTITTVNTDRQRRVVATTNTPPSVNDVAELERIFQSTYRRANVINLRQAFELEAWIKKLNPEAQVLILRPRKDVRVQAAFQVTVGEETRRMPDIGFWSTSG